MILCFNTIHSKKKTQKHYVQIHSNLTKINFHNLLSYEHYMIKDPPNGIKQPIIDFFNYRKKSGFPHSHRFCESFLQIPPPDQKHIRPSQQTCTIGQINNLFLNGPDSYKHLNFPACEVCLRPVCFVILPLCIGNKSVWQKGSGTETHAQKKIHSL